MKNKLGHRMYIFAYALCLMCGVTCFNTSVFAEGPGESDDGAKSEMIENNMQKKREKSPVMVLKQRIETLKPKPVLPTEKVLIRELNIVGSTLLAEEEIDKLNYAYYNQNKSLSGREMQRLADLITRAYSRNGYITSFAYIVPDKLTQGILEIRVAEGKTGKIEIKGNQYFSTKVLRKKISLKEGEPFNFVELNNDVYRINKHPDRKVSLELTPGDDPQVTNIAITVKDKSPMHVVFQADNYGSEYILRNRYKTFFTHNNLTGHDDTITIKVQRTEADAHQLADIDYYIPLNNQWKFQLYIMPYKVEDYYYSDNEDTGFEKRARKWYFNFYQSLIDKPDFELVSSYGFVFKDIHWYQGVEEEHWDNPTKRDMFRALMWGIDFNKADKYGRWVISNDLEIGIPRMWGGATAKDDMCSVLSSGGAYKKNHLVVARRQKLIAGIDFIGKAHWQQSSQTLTGVNVFSIGGIMGVIDNRGYPRAQAPGDSGRSITAGFSFPAYFVPKKVTIPYSKTKLYDSLKFFTFFDWGQTVLKSPKLATVAGDPNDKKITTLSSAGCGFTFSVPDKSLSMRLDLGWPLTHQMDKDGDHFHTWWSVTKGF